MGQNRPLTLAKVEQAIKNIQLGGHAVSSGHTDNKLAGNLVPPILVCIFERKEFQTDPTTAKTRRTGMHQ